MRRRTIQRWLFYTLFGCAPGLFTASADVVLTTNKWTITFVSGKWESASSWDYGVASINYSVHSFTPANTLDTVAIVDATTVASNVINGCLTMVLTARTASPTSSPSPTTSMSAVRQTSQARYYRVRLVP